MSINPSKTIRERKGKSTMHTEFTQAGQDPLSIRKRIETLENRMLTKAEVAKKFGMTVSWLNNSQNEVAVKLRSIGIKMGQSPTSPVRYSLSNVADIMEDQRKG